MTLHRQYVLKLHLCPFNYLMTLHRQYVLNHIQKVNTQRTIQMILAYFKVLPWHSYSYRAALKIIEDAVAVLGKHKVLEI